MLYKIRSSISLFVAGIFALSTIFIIGGYVWAFVMLRGITQPLVLHFNEFSGITQSGTLFDLFGVVIVALFGLFIDFFLVLTLEVHAPQLARLITYMTLLMSILLFIGFRVIIAVN